ncbi:HNH endonuclease [Clostridium neonatale]|uniref:HNH endonuclease n=1 Tax=Clostridium neonatale TaxID=137838 RepID=UPI00291C0874|nr:HNH endonuclease [Clostridium neonatale]CAI3193145.1 5-methylcytosine-specific restriction enzyme A [Clostridium neonatale]CAI3196918.1 5-methylcytosine-specific restriction enzyme A [Clostridium neonatale]
MTKEFYKSTKWKTKRERILKRDDYMCKECKRYGKTTGATTVHHVYPLEERPELKINNNNLISLCSKCHDKMHDRINNELTATGKQWCERLKNKIFDIPPPKNF